MIMWQAYHAKPVHNIKEKLSTRPLIDIPHADALFTTYITPALKCAHLQAKSAPNTPRVPPMSPLGGTNTTPARKPVVNHDVAHRHASPCPDGRHPVLHETPQVVLLL